MSAAGRHTRQASIAGIHSWSVRLCRIEGKRAPDRFGLPPANRSGAPRNATEPRPRRWPDSPPWRGFHRSLETRDRAGWITGHSHELAGEWGTIHSCPGRTRICSGGPKCRHDRRLKQHLRRKAGQLTPAAFRWMTPSGRQYVTEPARYPIWQLHKRVLEANRSLTSSLSRS